MTDVRLTALNPVDSQVYPVACNTSGELLVADGGPDLTVTGDLTVDGTASFDNGDVNIDSAGRLLVGASNSYGISDKVQVVSDTGINLHRGSPNTGAARVDLSKSRNPTYGSNTIVQSGDTLGSITFRGDDGTDYTTPASEIKVQVDGTPGTNDMPGRLIFSTTSNGASSPTERVRINSAGNLGIGVTSPSAKLDVNGTGNFSGNVTAPNITSLNALVNDLQTKMSLILRQIDISAETP